MTSNGSAPRARTAVHLFQIAERLVEAGFTLHDCAGPGRVLGGVCLTPTTAGAHLDGEGVIVTWAQHDRLAGDDTRYPVYEAIQDELNAVLGYVLELLGFEVHSFGEGGANLVVGPATDPAATGPARQWMEEIGWQGDGQA
jgi:hypothetical protein